MAFDYEVRLNIEPIIKKMGLEERGRVQQFITNEVVRLTEPYVPYDMAHLYDNPGLLKDSVYIDNETDVVWHTPYARYLYYHPEFNYQGAPYRGGMWVHRAMQNGGMDSIINGIRRMIR